MAKYTEWITEEGLIKIEGWARDGLADKQIAHNIGVSERTFTDWKKKFPAISSVLKKGKEVVDRQVENALFKRATGYTYTEVTKERIVDTGQKKRHNGESKLTEKDWEVALAYFDNKCAYCGQSGEMTKDHLDPLKNGGELTFSNVVPACRSCNSSKKDHNWLAWYQKQKFYAPQNAKRINEYILFTLVFPKEDFDQAGELVVTKEVTKQVAPDTGAIAFWLKNRKPDVWRDKKETEISGGLDLSKTAKEIEDFFGSDSS
uniref:HNH endonuclease n=1 Tax=Enterococcus avium TaxID=33945 RepID=UPI0035DEBFDA